MGIRGVQWEVEVDRARGRVGGKEEEEDVDGMGREDGHYAVDMLEGREAGKKQMKRQRTQTQKSSTCRRGIIRPEKRRR
ncbi:hypothetical protein PAXRUDRAFT_19301 [Paxillus rubicundulus Ve08.2h10]|uniref:Uncharacterized protein n=1 Tax=Paxillus rubicundulus Ve08.2h10 TaxID=930991 RepID=A0A0D0CVE9_9AGAM|nr:hypothetical protein PAXRUDRAFT_19301 [Paxillus rubicundulus Ve08.2h10]